MKTKLKFVVIFVLLAAMFGGRVTPASAAPGDLDLSFGTDGQVDTGVLESVG